MSSLDLDTPVYYRLDVAALPDELYKKEVPAQKWLEHATTVQERFPANSLNQLSPLDKEVEIERIFGVSLYLIGNVLPFFGPLLVVIATVVLPSPAGWIPLALVALYVATLFVVENYYFKPKFVKRYHRSGTLSPTDIKDNQYIFSERNTSKYCSLRFVWPRSMHRPAFENKPVIFCVIPHGAAPLGITAYPIWSKIFNDKICHWTCAPILLKLPIINRFLKLLGYVPAKSHSIIDILSKKEENIGIMLDGIAGMFQGNDEEAAHIRSRKGIIKIALRAGVAIVPVYAFGHTALWRIVVDPFGILKQLSLKLDVSFTPIFGRWGWFLGPPRRVAVCMCLGEPVNCPQIAQPAQQDIDKYHKQLLKHYQQVFEQHKEAYGWKYKKLKFV